MANSPMVDYRREPVLQARIERVSDAFGASSGLAIEEQHELRSNIATAFADRRRPTVIVKEVTPLIIEDFLRVVETRVIYLIRHPLAVAQSHLALGWLPHRRLLDRAGIGVDEREMLRTLWEDGSNTTRLVAYLGAVDSSVRSTLVRIGAITVTYEALSAGELGDAAPLFGSLGIDARDLSAPSIDFQRTDEYGVGDSRRQTVADATPVEIEESKNAWFAFNPPLYRQQTDWTLGTTESRRRRRH